MVQRPGCGYRQADTGGGDRGPGLHQTERPRTWRRGPPARVGLLREESGVAVAAPPLVGRGEFCGARSSDGSDQGPPQLPWTAAPGS
ncbi:hypothetical protein NDU88_002487 [Pleurodeles waltl]|uniref:Uncharacterized protein n=1 Tax=Pleurodeles waltl TaxID=8319 RepID=A0AAV7T294_PLEWA|nr:hypothetical protein NDU88_002487 [Pleurodeles waltl]